MALVLQRSDMKELFALVLAAFKGPDSHDEFYKFVDDALQLDIYQEFYRDAGLAKYALAVIKRTEKNGTTGKFVVALFVRRKGDANLRDFVRRLLPESLALVSDQEFEAERIRSAIEGVSGLDRLRKDPQVAEKIARLRFDLEDTANDLIELAAYKGMHDALHDLQVRLYYPISDAIRRLPKTTELIRPAEEKAIEELERYADQLTIIHADATEAAATLPTDLLASAERSWIGEFEQTSKNLSDAVLGKDRQKALAAEIALRVLLRRQPVRLNDLLVQTARKIPWDKLIETMGAVASSLSDNDPERKLILEAVRALESLMADVLARIEEHELWQQLETNFWTTEDALRRKAADEILVLWPIMSEQVHKICQKSPDDWARKLERHEFEFNKCCSNLAKPQLDARAQSAFRQLINVGRVRFYLVDRDLKAQCQQISKLSGPLKKLVPK